MELRVTQETASINEMVYDGAAEQSIECDFVLPEMQHYTPGDIQNVKRYKSVHRRHRGSGSPVCRA